MPKGQVGCPLNADYTPRLILRKIFTHPDSYTADFLGFKKGEGKFAPKPSRSVPPPLPIGGLLLECFTS